MGKYKGVHQRKNGTWYYRIKIMRMREKPCFYQGSGFATEEEAHIARIGRMRVEQFYYGYAGDELDFDEISFELFFQEFIRCCENASSAKKYQALYSAQLVVWKDREIHTIFDEDVDILLLRLYLKNYSKSYINSVRKLVRLIWEYANLVDPSISADIAYGISKEPYTLRVLSLFSGIGAPEQALSNLEVDYELIRFCEIDKKAEEAYCLLHNVSQSKNLGDITKIDYELSKVFPRFDLMFFGFPCTDISTAGKQKGLRDENGELTRSGLFFKAMELAKWKRPKFMIAENVAALMGKKFRSTFEVILREIEAAGYQVYTQVLNAQDFGLPQRRRRVFMVLVRNDLNMNLNFPEPIPLTVRAEDWFKDNVNKECYASQKQIYALQNSEHYRGNFKREIISCITTNWGTPSTTRQTFVEDDKGIRCLDSEELMRFQGFTSKQGELLREHKFTKNQVGKMVGNSIAVPVIQAILKQLFNSLPDINKDKKNEYNPYFSIDPLDDLFGEFPDE